MEIENGRQHQPMMSMVVGSKCGECSGEVIDVGDEFVCRTCGIACQKEVVETPAGGAMQAIDFTGQALGGYLGPPEPMAGGRFQSTFSASSSTYRYLKLVSDYSGREDSTVYGCAKMIERVAEKLSLPRIVVGQAVTIAKVIYGNRKVKLRVPSAAVSAYSIATACKILGVSCVSLREIVESHRLLGRRVKMSSMIRLSLDSPFKTRPRRPEDYLGAIIARLGTLPGPSAQISRERLEAPTYFARLRQTALEALSSVCEEERGGHSPCSLAATAVYASEAKLARWEGRRRAATQKDIARSAGVAEYTVRELYGTLFRQFLQRPPQAATPIHIQTPAR